jgi:hypothetical protein
MVDIFTAPTESGRMPAKERRSGAMLDAVTGKPIRVITHSTAGSYIDLPASQMEAVSKLFRENDIPHWSRHLIISSDGGAPMGVIYLRQTADPRRAQEILDAA